MVRLWTPVVALATFSTLVNAFYLPGAAPHDYDEGDLVPLYVNSLTPLINSDSSIRSVLSYDYYDPKLHFCRPKNGPKKQSESLGSILFGDRIESSPFQIKMGKNETCKPLCLQRINWKDAKFINDRIREGYAVNWLVDGLPAAQMKREEKTQEVFYSTGFELGTNTDGPNPWYNNHYDIYLEYHVRPDGKRRVVGVLVYPRSVNSMPHGAPTANCDLTEPFSLDQTNNNAFSVQEYGITYSVYWAESATPWATRWDNYLHIFDPKIHFFSLINSIVIAVFLCVMVGMILLRTVHRDISRYNAFDLTEDVQEDFGWKLVHGEVFRRPDHPMLLSITIGSGAQLTAMSGVTLFFALLGFLSPSNRGSLSTVMIVCYTFFGAVAGYFSSRTYLTLGGEKIRQNILWTSLLFPTILFAALNALNFVLIASGSSGAVPFGTFIAIIALWFLINVPLTVIGSIYGIRKGPISHPTRVNQIPRQIPPLIWYLKPVPSALLAGILPFGAAFLELFFVLSSLFGSKAYYAFGFLALTFFVVALTTATVTILMCYFHLCGEEYRWHWRAFVTGGGSAFWLFGYGLVYWATRLSLEGFASKFLYIGYLILISLLDFMVTGTIGFLATYFFLTKIYSRIRVD